MRIEFAGDLLVKHLGIYESFQLEYSMLDDRLDPRFPDIEFKVRFGGVKPALPSLSAAKGKRKRENLKQVVYARSYSVCSLCSFTPIIDLL